MVGARYQVFRRLLRGCFLANSTCVLTRRVNHLRPFFRFINGRVPPIASKRSRSGNRVSFLGSNRTSLRVFFRLREGIIFEVFYQFSVLIHMGARREGITYIAEPRPIINVDSRFASKEEEDPCRAGVAMCYFSRRVVFISSVGDLRLRLYYEDCFCVLNFNGAFYCITGVA